MVKMYDHRHGSHDGPRAVRMHDLVELVGVLYIPPRDTSDDGQKKAKRTHSNEEDGGDVPRMDHVVDVSALLSGADDVLEESLYGAPGGITDRHPAITSSLPTIHCLVYRIVGASFPLLESPTDPHSSLVLVLGSQGEGGHGEGAAGVLACLSSALAGDRLAGHFLRLAVLSKTYRPNNNKGREQRAEADEGREVSIEEEEALGVLPVNLYNLPRGDVRISRVVRALRQILPRVQLVRPWQWQWCACR